MMSKAEKMFADAGWERQELRLAYWKHKKFIDGKEKDYCIAFLEGMHQVHLYCVGGEEVGHFMEYINSLDMETLLAINQQCVELGWLLRKNDEDD